MSAEELENADDSDYVRYLGGLEKSVDRDNFGLQVGELLYGVQMYEYIRVFHEHNIGINLFLALNEDDLRELGVKDKDIGTISKVIQCLQQNSNSKGTENVKNAHVGVEPEPKMSMRKVLVMQTNTAKQLKQIKETMEVIEDKLKENQFNNTLVDTDYCAAHALKIVCTELVRQTDILLEESQNLNNVLQRVHQDNKVTKPQCHKFGFWTGMCLAVLASMAIIINEWKSLRK